MALQNLKISFQRDEDKLDKKKNSDKSALEIVFADEDSNSNHGSEDIVINVDLSEKQKQTTKPKIYENKGLGNFAVGFDPTSKENISRKQKRSERFGIQWSELAQEDYNLEKLYDRLGINKTDVETGGDKGWRLNAVHIRGVDDMSTEDVFRYFEGFAPACIEWINDTSCNVVWSDREGAGRAMLARMQPSAMDNATPVGLVSMSIDNDKITSADVSSIQNVDDGQQKSTSDTAVTSARKKNKETKQKKIKSSGETQVKEAKTRPAVKEQRVEEQMEEDLTFSLVSDDEDANVKQATTSAAATQSASSSSSSSSSSSGSESSSSSSSSDDSSSDSDMETTDTFRQRKSTVQAKKSSGPAEVDEEGEIASDHSVTSDHQGGGEGQGSTTIGQPAVSPPGLWLVGVHCEKTRAPLYMRFANKDDQKQRGAEKKSQYYVKYGNPNFGGMRGLLSGSRRRRLRADIMRSEAAEAKRAVKRTASQRSGEDTFDNLLKEAQKRQKRGSESDHSESEEDIDNDLIGGSDDEGDVRVELGVPDNRGKMVGRMMRADLEEEEKQLRREQLETMRTSYVSLLPVQVGDMRRQIEQRKQERVSESSRQTVDLRQNLDLRRRLEQKRR